MSESQMVNQAVASELYIPVQLLSDEISDEKKPDYKNKIKKIKHEIVSL